MIFERIYRKILRAYVNIWRINFPINPPKRAILASKWGYARSLITWALVLLLGSGCQRYGQWQYHHVSQRQTDSTRILYRSKTPATGIDVEMMKSHEELTTYLQVHSTPLPSEDGKAEVQIQAGEKTITFWAHLHEGGQRIRLTDSLQTMLISSLTEGNPVILQLQGYRETLSPKKFEKIFEKFDKPPYKIPIHLPL